MSGVRRGVAVETVGQNCRDHNSFHSQPTSLAERVNLHERVLPAERVNLPAERAW